MDGLTPDDLAVIRAHVRMVEGLLREWEYEAREGRVPVPTVEQIEAAQGLGKALILAMLGEEDE